MLYSISILTVAHSYGRNETLSGTTSLIFLNSTLSVMFISEADFIFAGKLTVTFAACPANS